MVEISQVFVLDEENNIVAIKETKNKMLILRLKTFVNSLWFHIWSGFPKSSLEQIRDRYQICIMCESYNIKEKYAKNVGAILVIKSFP